MYKKILLIAVSTLAIMVSGQQICKTDADCDANNFCIRGAYCMSGEQLKYLAEVYTPIEAVAKVNKQFKAPQCKFTYECEEGMDRCSKGACLSDEKTDIYRKEMSDIFAKSFGKVDLSSLVTSVKCVSNSQCQPGDICYQGACADYSTAMTEIKSNHQRYQESKRLSSQ